MTERRILIVEDEPIISTSLSETLQGKGWHTQVAATAPIAIEAFQGFKPDIILMDINLEAEYDGIEVAQAIRNRSDTPIIFLTGHSDPETFEKARQTLPYGFMSKPVQNNQLCHAVELALTQVQDRRKTKPALLAVSSALVKLQYAVLTVNTDGDLLGWNEVALQAVGAERLIEGSAVGKVLESSSTDEITLIQTIRKAAQNQDSTDLTKTLKSLKLAWEYILIAPLDPAQGEGVMVLLRRRAPQAPTAPAVDEVNDPLTGLPRFHEANLKRVPDNAACAFFQAQNYMVIATRLGRHVADEVMLAFTMNIGQFFDSIAKTMDCRATLFRAAGPLVVATLEADEFGLSQVRRAISQFMSSRRNSLVDLVSQPGTLVSISANHILLPATAREKWVDEANQLNDRRTL